MSLIMANKANLMNIYTPKSQLLFVNHPVATPNAFNMYDYIIVQHFDENTPYIFGIWPKSVIYAMIN